MSRLVLGLPVSGWRLRHRHGLALPTVALVFALGIPPATAALAPVESGHRARLAAVRAQIRKLQQVLDRSQTRRADLEHGLRTIEEQLAGLSRSLGETQSQLAQGTKKLAALHGRQQALQIKLAQERSLLTAQVRAAYAMGRQEQIKMLLNQQDPARLGRMLVYYDYFNRARVQEIDAVRTTLDQINTVASRIADENARLTKLRDEQSAEQSTLADGRATRRQLLAKLDQRIRLTGQQITRLRENERQLVQLLAKLARRPAVASSENPDETPFVRLKGKLLWPTRGRLGARYGSPRDVGDLRWQGVLIEAPEGREVRAVSHGRVAFADWLRGFGLLVIIDHGNGFMSLYGHNESVLKEVGDWVEAGEVIARVGTTGGQQEPGLYFAIRRNGLPVNPMAWCTPVKGLNVGMNWPG